MSNPTDDGALTLDANQRVVHILLVEDDPGHARLIEKGLRRSGINNPLKILDDGQKAIDYLFSDDREKHIPLLVLLDLNLPILDGYEVLQRMKADESLRRVPVIILTTTDDLREVSKCYTLGCNVYITKPVEYGEFSDALKKLGLFLSVVQIPAINGETNESTE